jgi:hypothetical protein
VRSATDGLVALRAALCQHGGTVADALGELPADGGSSARPGPAQIAAAGPRADGRQQEVELLIEMILEGSRLHYGQPRLVSAGDPDLALLLGDQLYALGLSRLAALGDLDAVAELADVISLVAQAHAAGDPDLAEAVWEAGAVAVGWGSSEAHRSAKTLAGAQDRRARDALRAVAGRAIG